VNQCTNKVSSFSRSRDIYIYIFFGETKTLNGSCDRNHTSFRGDMSSVW